MIDPLKQCGRCGAVYDTGLVHTCFKEDITLFKQKKMEKTKDKLEEIGKKIDDSIYSAKEKSKRATKSIAGTIAKKSAAGLIKATEVIGRSVGNQVKAYSTQIKKDIGIKDEMTPGQKAGVVIEKLVDFVGKGVNKVAEKIEEGQAKKFATIRELKVEGYDCLIGQDAKGAIPVGRAVKCKEYVKKLQSDKKVLPYQLKDVRKEILDDVIKSASTNVYELLNYLTNRKSAETRAEIDYLKKEIDVVKQKLREEKDDTKNES